MGESEKQSNNLLDIYRVIVIILLVSSVILLFQLNKKAYNTNKFLASLVIEKNQKSPLDITYGPNDILIGQKEAPVTLFVYTSYRCKYCKEFFETNFKTLKKEYIDEGIVKIIIKNLGYTNDSISLLAVKAAYCAYGEGKFFDMHMKLLEEYDVINKTILMNWFAESNIDSTQFNICLENRTLNKLIIDNRKEMRAIGAKGTPAFVIGDNVINGNRPIAKFRELIELEMETCCE